MFSAPARLINSFVGFIESRDYDLGEILSLTRYPQQGAAPAFHPPSDFKLDSKHDAAP